MTSFYSSAHNLEAFEVTPNGPLPVATREIEPWPHPLDVDACSKAEAERILANHENFTLTPP